MGLHALVLSRRMGPSSLPAAAMALVRCWLAWPWLPWCAGSAASAYWSAGGSPDNPPRLPCSVCVGPAHAALPATVPGRGLPERHQHGMLARWLPLCNRCEAAPHTICNNSSQEPHLLWAIVSSSFFMESCAWLLVACAGSSSGVVNVYSRAQQQQHAVFGGGEDWVVPEAPIAGAQSCGALLTLGMLGHTACMTTAPWHVRWKTAALTSANKHTTCPGCYRQAAQDCPEPEHHHRHTVVQPRQPDDGHGLQAQARCTEVGRCLRGVARAWCLIVLLVIKLAAAHSSAAGCHALTGWSTSLP